MPKIDHKVIGKHIRRVIVSPTPEEAADEQSWSALIAAWEAALEAMQGKKYFQLADLPNLVTRVEVIEKILMRHGWLPEEDEDV